MEVKIGDVILYQFWNNYNYMKYTMEVTKIARKYIYGKVAYFDMFLEGMKCSKDDDLAIHRDGQTTQIKEVTNETWQT